MALYTRYDINDSTQKCKLTRSAVSGFQTTELELISSGVCTHTYTQWRLRFRLRFRLGWRLRFRLRFRLGGGD